MTNPIQVLMNVKELSPVEAFNYCRYELKGKGTRAIVKYYDNELPKLTELDNNLSILQEDLLSNMKIFKDYLEN